MKLSITLDRKTADWARIYAAERGKSISQLLGEILRDRMREVCNRDYKDAMRRYFAKKPFKFQWADGSRPEREELYDRANHR
ncbi:MAG TPA: hypothetical protein VNZ53_49640 [Steroidobacteraceae bacterium]|jgi:hypothetical protein|nr:hypothetical protein [Steroidobacteraceae bacterium]